MSTLTALLAAVWPLERDAKQRHERALNTCRERLIYRWKMRPGAVPTALHAKAHTVAIELIDRKAAREATSLDNYTDPVGWHWLCVEVAKVTGVGTDDLDTLAAALQTGQLTGETAEHAERLNRQPPEVVAALAGQLIRLRPELAERLPGIANNIDTFDTSTPPPVLDRTSKQILTILGVELASMTQVDISTRLEERRCDLDISAVSLRAIRSRVHELLARGLIEQPSGPKGGLAITEAGKRALQPRPS